MTKKPSSTEVARAFSFYRPHDRRATAYTGELLNPTTGELFKPPARTKQSFKAECDINTILKQYRVTGQIQHISAQAAKGAYRDLPDDVDFQSALNTVIRAEEAFASLPSKTRDRFNNDPELFLAFMADPSNQDEIIKMGLATDNRPPSPPPTSTTTTSQPTQPSTSTPSSANLQSGQGS